MRRWLALSIVAVITCAGSAQARECALPPPVTTSAETNLFTPEQEMQLGDILAERAARDYQLVEDDALNAYLQAIADRLLKSAPTSLRIRLQLVDLDEVNAFTTPGGHIYVTRKLVVFARSEDELAGVLGHELGHAVARDPAIEMSRRFREVLGVTSLGERRDIYEKYNQFLDRWRTRKINFNEKQEQREQLAADQMAIYAMVRAGYDPKAFGDFWDRLAETKGKTGNWLSDLFGATRPESRRLKEVLRSADAIPEECAGAAPGERAEGFRKWQAKVIEYSARRAEALHGVIWKRHLEPPLRPDITNLKFSPDGKHILAQDETGLYVLTREPLAVQFHIDANEARPAMFTPDSRAIVFYDHKLRVEKWDIATQKREWVREMALPRHCVQTALAPDGSTLACYGLDDSLRLATVADSQVIFEKKDFYRPTFADVGALLFTLLTFNPDEGVDLRLLGMQFSPDAHYFAAGRGLTSIAFDLSTRAPMSVPGGIRELIGGRFSFLGTDRIAGAPRGSTKAMVLTFPAGGVVFKDLFIGGSAIEATTGGDYILLRPLKDYPVGVFDPKQNKLLGANKVSAYDVYAGQNVSERRNGELGLYKVAESQPLSVSVLPESPLGRLRAFDVSSDFKTVALSQLSRGAVWKLETSQRAAYVRGFRGAWIESDRHAYLDFPKLEKTERTIAQIDLHTGEVDKLREMQDEKSRGRREPAWQYGEFLITVKSKNESDSLRDVDLEVADVRTGTPLWSRQYSRGPHVESDPVSGSTLILSWWINSAAAREEFRSDPALKAKYDALQEKHDAYLLEVVEARTGRTLGKLLIDTGKGSFHIASVTAAGHWAAILDSKNRVRIYSLASGEEMGTLFGNYAALAPESGLLMLENTPRHVSIYKLEGLAERDQFTFPSAVSRVRFSTDGRQLFVLTTDQNAYLLDLKAAAN